MTDQLTSGGSQKFFFDISGVVDYIQKIDRYSGIQRVVATLIAEVSDIIEPELLYLSWCDKSSGRQLCLPFSALGKETFASPSTMRQFFHPGRPDRAAIPSLRKYSKAPLKFYFHRTRLDLASMAGHKKSFRRYNLTQEAWREQRRGQGPQPKPKMQPKPQDLLAEASAGDLLVLLDFAGQSRHLEHFQAAKQEGLIVHSLIYDLIPIVVPHLVPGQSPLQFYDWMLKMVELTDRFMAISEASRQDTLSFLKEHGSDADVIAVPLAQAPVPKPAVAHEEIDARPLSKGIKTDLYPDLKSIAELDEQIRQLLIAPFVLCVGTIESRKNSWRIAMAWKQLLDAGHTNLPKLVFAGRFGAAQEDFVNLLNATGNVYGHICILEGPSDETLDLLYRKCSFFIMASLYEGWGLPVGEALAYGKTAVVADNSSLPEVGGSLVEYCDAKDISSIAQAVARLTVPEHRVAMEDRVRKAQLRDWSQVAQDLKKALLEQA